MVDVLKSNVNQIQMSRNSNDKFCLKSMANTNINFSISQGGKNIANQEFRVDERKCFVLDDYTTPINVKIHESKIPQWEATFD